MIRVYLAGPEVFLPDARAVLDRKITLTRAAGLEPVAPGDLEIPVAATVRERGLNIYRADETLMLSADAIIANLTPFRGLHPDPGTVFELGFMRGRGKPAFAYSNTTATHYQRLMAHYGGRLVASPDGELRGPDGLMVEAFDMNDNLMLDGAIDAGGGAWETRDAAPDRVFSDTEAFEAVLAIAVRRLTEARPGA